MVTNKTTDTDKTKKIFENLIREEVRFHTELFGLSRFLGFPIFIFVLLSIGLFSAVEFSLGSIETVILSVHGLFFVLALQIGSVAFMAEDAASDLLGGRSTLLYSHTYLPVTQEQLIVLFSIKDILFYFVLFVIPATVSAMVFLPLSIANLVTLLISLTLAFVLGIGFSLFLASLGLKNRVQSVLTTAFLIVSLIVVFTQTSLQFTDIVLFTAPSTTAKLVVGVSSMVLILAFGFYSSRNLELSQETEKSVTYIRLFKKLFDFPTSFNQQNKKLAGITIRTLSDVFRSGGGIFKVGFTVAILIGLTAYLLNILHQTTSINPDYVITITSIIALASYANYVLLFQNDSMNDYLYLPLTKEAVKRSKRMAFHLFNTGILLVVAFTSMVLFNSSLLIFVTVIGLVIVMSEFYFELTFALAGFEPMDFLFDTVRFTVFSVILMVLFIPLLVVGLFGVYFLTTGQIAIFILISIAVFARLTMLLKKIEIAPQELI